MTIRFASCIAAALFLVAMPVSAAETYIQCPVSSIDAQVTTKLPAGWWATPQRGELVGTEIVNIGGKGTMSCQYRAFGTEVSVMREIPRGKDCRPSGSGFKCGDAYIQGSQSRSGGTVVQGEPTRKGGTVVQGEGGKRQTVRVQGGSKGTTVVQGEGGERQTVRVQGGSKGTVVQGGGGTSGTVQVKRSPSVKTGGSTGARGEPRVALRCPDPWVETVKARNISRDADGKYFLELVAEIGNRGSNDYVPYEGQQTVELRLDDGRESSGAIRSWPFRGIAQDDSFEVAYVLRNWQTTNDWGYRFEIVYAPGIREDATPWNDDCLASNNSRLITAGQINSFIRRSGL